MAAFGPCNFSATQRRRHDVQGWIAIVVGGIMAHPQAEKQIGHYWWGLEITAEREYSLVSDLVRHHENALKVFALVDCATRSGCAHARHWRQPYDLATHFAIFGNHVQIKAYENCYENYIQIQIGSKKKSANL